MTRVHVYWWWWRSKQEGKAKEEKERENPKKTNKQFNLTHQLSRLHHTPARHHALSIQTLRSAYISGRHCLFGSLGKRLVPSTGKEKKKERKLECRKTRINFMLVRSCLTRGWKD